MPISENSIKYLKTLYKTPILLSSYWMLASKTKLLYPLLTFTVVTILWPRPSIHHTVNITTTEAELFTIRCGINQAIHIANVSCIIVITDAIHSAKKIFDSSPHPYQVQSIAIVKDLRDFFKRNSDNLIVFWECPSKAKWKHQMETPCDRQQRN